MAYTLNRRLAELIDSSGQLNTGKIPNAYISTDHFANNSITQGKLHSTFVLPSSALSGVNTDSVSEGSTNLYFTNARADARIAAANTGDLSEVFFLFLKDAPVPSFCTYSLIVSRLLHLHCYYLFFPIYWHYYHQYPQH